MHPHNSKKLDDRVIRAAEAALANRAIAFRVPYRAGAAVFPSFHCGA